MKIAKMLLIVSIALSGCFSESEQMDSHENVLFTGNEGAPINDDIAHNWMARYASSENKMPQFNLFSRERIEEVLIQNDVVGIRFYIGRQDNGSETIILTGVKNTGRSLIFEAKNSLENYYTPLQFEIGNKQSIDARNSLSSLVTKSNGQTAIKRYRDEDQNRLRGFYWGRNIIEEILQIKGSIGITLALAINENDELKPVLFAINENAEIRSKSATGERVEDHTTFIDESKPCPDMCDPELE